MCQQEKQGSYKNRETPYEDVLKLGWMGFISWDQPAGFKGSQHISHFQAVSSISSYTLCYIPREAST